MSFFLGRCSLLIRSYAGGRLQLNRSTKPDLLQKWYARRKPSSRKLKSTRKNWTCWWQVSMILYSLWIMLTLSQADISEPPITISQLAVQQERIKKREADIKAKRAKIRAFHGLPPVRLYVYFGKPSADSYKPEPECGTHAIERSAWWADGADQTERAHSWQDGRRRLITPPLWFYQTHRIVNWVSYLTRFP